MPPLASQTGCLAPYMMQPESRPVSVVVINYGTPNLIDMFLRSLVSSPDAQLLREIVVVDSGWPLKASSQSLVQGRRWPRPVHSIPNCNHSYASGVNAGVRATTAPYVLLANSDIVFGDSPVIPAMLHEISQCSAVGVSGIQLLYPDGAWQESYGSFIGMLTSIKTMLLWDVVVRLRAKWWYRCRLVSKEVDYVVGAFMLLRRTCFEEAGGFDEGFAFYGEESDFCYRAKQLGWRVRFSSHAIITHVGGASSTKTGDRRFERALLGAKAEFLRVHLPRWQGPMAGHALILALRTRRFVRLLLHHLRSRFALCRQTMGLAQPTSDCEGNPAPEIHRGSLE